MVELSTSQALASLSDEIKQLVDQQIITLTSAAKSKRAHSQNSTSLASNCQVPLVQPTTIGSDTCASSGNATRTDLCVVSTNLTSALTHPTALAALATATSQTIPKDNNTTTIPPLPPTSDDLDGHNIPAIWKPKDDNDDVAVGLERSEKISTEYIREVENNSTTNQQQAHHSRVSSNFNSSTNYLIEPHQQPHQQQLSDPSVESLYQLRALKGSKSIIEEPAGISSGPNSGLWSNSFNASSLSADLIDETLNYFVNCRHRLSQITKTFDDSDAYILLLQEKEMDLELVARIGQDLLKQFNEVKESNESLRDELQKVLDNNEELRQALQKCQEDNQQLRYELASKVTLLDTFMQEEEEQQDIRDASLSSRNQHSDGTAACDDYYSDYNQPLSLRYQHGSSHRQASGSAANKEAKLQERVSELLEELLAKDEVMFKQTLVQQERSFQLEVELRESEHKVSELESENEALRDSQKELYEEIKTQNRNFSELLRIFAESQQESKMHHINNISFDSYTEPPPSFESHLNNGPCSSSFFTDHNNMDHQQHHINHDTQHHHHHSHHHHQHQHHHTSPHPQATTSSQLPTATPTESTCSCLCESPLLVELSAASAHQHLSDQHKIEEDEDEHERVDLPVLEWSKRATHNPLFLSISASFVVVILIAAKRRG